ncbi:MAG TPA: hypothetical protein VNW46_19235 [Gemmatimonadaceae bacterium]|nr:hypothetical protein [Gemmatimonadaceae bacterium]
MASRDATRSLAGQVLLYQIATLTVRLFDQVELEGDADAQTAPGLPMLRGVYLTALGESLRGIRPGVSPTVNTASRSSSAFRVLVGAETDVTHSDLYVGATDWAAQLSVVDPQPIVAPGDLAVGALAAGALGAAEIFKRVFGNTLTGAVQLTPGTMSSGYSLSLLTYSADQVDVAPPLPDAVAIDLALVGCGSIGCAVVLGLAVSPRLVGLVTTIDNGRFDERNPFKYALLDWATAHAKRAKAVWARETLAGLAVNRLRVRAFVGTGAAFVASQPVDESLPLVISAVDTGDARFEIQDMLPKRIVNGGIDGTVAEVSVHGFGDGPCLACLAMERDRESWNAQPIAQKIGLSAGRVLALIQGNEPMHAADIAQIKAAGCAPAGLLADVDTFLGQPVLSFYNRVAYSETTITTVGGAQARVTAAFVSAYAGALILAELIKEAVPDLHPWRVTNAYRQDLLGVPAGGLIRYQRDATGWCTCHSSFRGSIYRERYGA